MTVLSNKQFEAEIRKLAETTSTGELVYVKKYGFGVEPLSEEEYKEAREETIQEHVMMIKFHLNRLGLLPEGVKVLS